MLEEMVELESESNENVHIDRSKGAVGDRTTQRPSKGEASIEVKTIWLFLGDNRISHDE